MVLTAALLVSPVPPRACSPARAIVVSLADDDRRCLGDVVGGVHGGKYQFGAFAGDEFASALAASGAGEYVDAEADSPWPRWARELKRESPEVQETLQLGADGSAQVVVRNLFRTWERYYASVLPAGESSGGDAFEVVPSAGHLAPRGGVRSRGSNARGPTASPPTPQCFASQSTARASRRAQANNVCDASKPYSDSAVLTVRACVGGGAGGRREARLLVRTEEEQWLFRVVGGAGGDADEATRDAAPAPTPASERSSGSESSS